MRKIILFNILIIANLISYSQEIPVGEIGTNSTDPVDTTMVVSTIETNSTNGEQLHEVVPPSPSLSNMQEYGNYEVNYSTGKTAISIPLYTVVSGSLSLPISISCNTSGRKVEDIGSQLGVGWSLNTGAVITRTIVDKVDEYFYADPPYHNKHWLPYIDPLGKDTTNATSPFYSFTSLKYGTSRTGYSYDWINSFNIGADGNWGGLLDVMNVNNVLIQSYCENDYDIFRYSLPSGKSGSFIMKGKENGEVEAMTIPYEPVKIILPNNEIRNGGSTYDIHKIIIVDTDGTQYYFGEGTEGQIAIEENHQSDPDDPQNSWKRGNTGWFLTSVVSATKSDTIELFYEQSKERINGNNMIHYIVDVFNTTEYLNYLDDPHSVYENTWPKYIDDFYYSTKPRFYKNYIPQSIKVKNSSVVFYNTIDNASTFYCKTCDDWRNSYIDSIGVYTNTDDLVKKFVFDLSTENQYTNHKLLDQISIHDGANKEVKKYQFDYYDSTDIHMDRFNTNSRDWWGFFNNANNNQPMPPIQNIFSRGKLSLEGGSEQNPIVTAIINQRDVQFGVFSSTTSHTCDKSSNLIATRQGMLKEIHYPTGGSSEFVYELNEFNNLESGGPTVGAGLRIADIINKDAFGNTITNSYAYSAGEMRDYYQPTLNNLISEQWIHKSYPCGGSCGPTDMVYGIDYRLFTYTGDLKYAPVFHSNLVEYQNVSVEITKGNDSDGSIEYDYELPYFYGEGESSLYDNIFNGNVSPLIDYEIHSSHSFSNYLNGLTTYNPQKYTNVEHDWKEPLLSFVRIYNKSGELVAETHTQYDYYEKDDVFTNSAHRYIGLQFSATEANQETFEQWWYEDGYYLTEMGVSRNSFEIFSIGYNKFVSASIKPTTITKRENISGANAVTSLKTIEYWDDYLLPKREVVQLSNGKTQEVNYSYPSQESTQPYISMVDSNIIAPIITKKINTGSSAWEEVQTNYHQYSPNVIKPQTIVNSSNVNTLGKLKVTFDAYDTDGKITKFTGDDGLTTYILWAYNETHPVAKIVSSNSTLSLSSLQTIVDKTSFTEEDSYSDILTDVNNLKSALNTVLIDDEYQVSFYTYKPLVGMTSETGPDGRTTYYEYDDFGRLAYVRNHKGEILKKYEYNYAN